MLRLEQENDRCTVWQDELCLGTVILYDNSCHMGNCYLKLELECYDTSVSAELFRTVGEVADRPLQMMVGSDDAVLVRFLTAGGFVCKRKCYEVEAGLEDYVGAAPDISLSECGWGEKDYDRCCEMLYDHYLETHRDINPWTADYEAFLENLPNTVVYRENGGTITALVFVEENEIAYVCGTDVEQFTAFASGLISWMFERHETIFFESDDCDWASMALKSLFANQDGTSFDTYVLTGK